jgi:hypothetical protein
MKALVLEEIRKLTLRDIDLPLVVGPTEAGRGPHGAGA